MNKNRKPANPRQTAIEERIREGAKPRPLLERDALLARKPRPAGTKGGKNKRAPV